MGLPTCIYVCTGLKNGILYLSRTTKPPKLKVQNHQAELSHDQVQTLLKAVGCTNDEEFNRLAVPRSINVSVHILGGHVDLLKVLGKSVELISTEGYKIHKFNSEPIPSEPVPTSEPIPTSAEPDWDGMVNVPIHIETLSELIKILEKAFKNAVGGTNG